MTDEPAGAREEPATVDDAIAAIAATSRRARTPTPRWMWTLAAVLGVGGAIAFAIVLLASADPSGPVADPAATRHGLGFGAGLMIGLVAGVGVGVAIARRRT